MEPNNISLTIGLDEAGRGPLVGPVVAGAVALPKTFLINLLNDSKKLTEKKREEVSLLIRKECLYGIGVVSHKMIDRVNILNATMHAMKKALIELLNKLPTTDDLFLDIIIDGNKKPDFEDIKRSFDCSIKACALIKADASTPCVMAASIIAKTKRDDIMRKFDALFPSYDWVRNKGYPTKDHRERIKRFGPAPIARRTFRGSL